MTQFDRQYWMGSIDDLTPLDQISIPGTHESCARYGGQLFVCQTLSIEDQLYQGLRFFDIRCRQVKNAFKIMHKYVYEHLDFGPDIQDVCMTFLESHPRETIVMSIKHEYEGSDNTQAFDSTFLDYTIKYPFSWFVDERIPLLSEVRGKIVLLRRFSAESPPLGFDGTAPGWKDDATFVIQNAITMFVEDKYIVPTVFNIGAKWDRVKSALENAASRQGSGLFLTFSSGADTFPVHVAKGTPGITGVNDHLNAYLAEQPATFRGVVAMDFPEYPYDTVLIDQIIGGNSFLPFEGREITCIRKHEHSDPKHPLRWVGGYERPSGKPFSITQLDCIEDIKAGKKYFVRQGGAQANVIVQTHQLPWETQVTPFITTVADNTKADNLLSLPDCPQGPLDQLFRFG